MKIGLDVAQTCVERAGCAWHADALSRALIAEGLPRGHTFELYHHFGDWINHDPRGGTVVEDSRVTRPLQGMAPPAARAFWAGIESGEPLPGKPDAVISFSYHAPRLPHTKLVYTVHDLAFWSHPDFSDDATRLLCQRELLQATARATGFLFVSEATRREFGQLLPNWLESTQRPHALSPGASRFPRATAPRAWSDSAPWLIVGSVEPRKNHAAALDAYEAYLAQSALRRPLVIAGGHGWKSDALHGRIAALAGRGVPVRYLGYVPERELAALYAGAFALLAPSWHEGFGLPVVEAMGFGLPVLAADRTSLPEVGGSAGRYFPPDQPELLARLMLTLEAEPASHARLAAESLARSADFSWAATAKSVLEFVERL
ncbi:MAG: glycosyltransferase family 4 protein [Verrucomicrobia bacterium]|nr:glycosyltransferase family 4 protein [Verrucomicrobiota bacterium]